MLKRKRPLVKMKVAEIQKEKTQPRIAMDSTREFYRFLLQSLSSIPLPLSWQTHNQYTAYPVLSSYIIEIFAVLISAFKQWNYYCCKWEWWKEFVYWPMKIKYFQVLNKRQTASIKIFFNQWILFSNESIMIMIEKIHKYNRNGT